MATKNAAKSTKTAAAEADAKGQRENLSRKPRDKGKKAIAEKAIALETLKVEYVPRLSVSPNTWNPNRQSEHDFELLCRSMEEDGFTQPVIVLRGSRMIVDGEHRWRAAGKVYGENADIPVVFVDMTPEQAKIATLRHNRARGSEDVELSAAILKDLQALGALEWAASSLLMDDAELNRMMDDISAPDALAGEQYGEAWTPETIKGAGKEAGANTIEGGGATVAATQNAAEQLREREKKLATARSEEERQKALKDSDVMRLSFIFTGEQARLVKRVLGANPAEKILKLCEKEEASVVPEVKAE